jgi:hypothetical protein
MSDDQWAPRFLVVAVTLGFLAALGYLLVYGMPQTASEPVLVLLGALGSGWTGVLAFYFGSTAGSRHKTELLARQSQDGG